MNVPPKVPEPATDATRQRQRAPSDDGGLTRRVDELADEVRQHFERLGRAKR